MRLAYLLRWALFAAPLLLAWSPAAAKMAYSSSFELPDEPPLPQGETLPPPEFPIEWRGEPLSGGGAGTTKWDTSYTHSGERSVSLSCASGVFGLAGPRVGLDGVEWIRAGAWTRTWEADGGAAVWLVWLDRQGKLVGADRSTPVVSPERWSWVVVEAAVPQGAAAVRPVLALLSPGMAWFDDVDVRARTVADIGLEALSLGEPRAGERCSIRLTLEASGRLPSTDKLEIEMTSVAGRRVAAQGSFAVQLPRVGAPGTGIVLGPFDLRVDPYATPGEYYLTVRLGDVLLNTLELPNGRFALGGRPRVPEDGPSATVALLAPSAASAGDTLTVEVGAVVSAATDEALIAAAWLRKGRATYAATEGLLARAPEVAEGRTAGTGQLELVVPEGLPDGEYQVEAFLVGRYRGASATGAVTISGGSGLTRVPACGRYLGSDGASHAWRTTDTGMLVWDGMPYVPVGLTLCPSYLTELDPADAEGNQARWEAFLEDTRRLAAMDLRDVYVRTGPLGLADLPVEAVQRVVDRLEKLGFRYGLEIGGAWPQPMTGYRIGRTERLRDMPAGNDHGLVLEDSLLPPESWALVAIYQCPPGPEPVRVMRIPVNNSSLTLRIPPEAGDATYTAWATLEVEAPEGMGPGDVADDASFRARKASVSRALEALRFGSGLRFLSNPLSGDIGLPPADIVPSFASTFADRFARWLELRYGGDLARLNTAWRLAPKPGALPSFAVAGRLVALGGPGPDLLMADPLAEHWYLLDPEHSSYVADLEAFREEIQAESLCDITAAVRSIVDVPTLLVPGSGLVPAGPEDATAVLAAPLSTGKHLVSRDPIDGTDGVALCIPTLEADASRPVQATRLGENRLSLRLPWIIGITGMGPEVTTPAAAVAALAEWGAKAAYLELPPSTASGPREWPSPERAALRETLIAASQPVLVGAYPRSLRTPVGPADGRPLALAEVAAAGAAVAITDRVWLVPAAVLPPESTMVFAASSPRTDRDGIAAEEIEAYLRDAPEPGLILVGPREDLGEIPSLDSLLLPTYAPCAFGAGEAQQTREGSGLEAVREGEAGWPVLVHRGGLWLFPVRGLDLEGALWVLRGLYGAADDSVGGG